MYSPGTIIALICLASTLATGSRLPRVLGGYETLPDQWPFMSALYRITVTEDSVPSYSWSLFRDEDLGPDVSPTSTNIEYTFFCGSVVWDRRHILTAAHCAYGRSPSEIGVYLGHWNQEPLVKSDIRAVEKIFIHSGYNNSEIPADDIALLRLVTPIDFSTHPGPRTIAPVPRPLEAIHRLDRHHCLTLGWGRTESNQLSKHLRQTAVFAESCRPQCVDGLGKIRAGDHIADRDACNGDSGGPLMCPNHKGHYRLVGLTSYGDVCTQGIESWGTYTYVRHYRDWISRHTGVFVEEDEEMEASAEGPAVNDEDDQHPPPPDRRHRHEADQLLPASLLDFQFCFKLCLLIGLPILLVLGCLEGWAYLVRRKERQMYYEF